MQSVYENKSNEKFGLRYNLIVILLIMKTMLKANFRTSYWPPCSGMRNVKSKYKIQNQLTGISRICYNPHMKDSQMDEIGKKLDALNARGVILRAPYGTDSLAVYAAFNKKLGEISQELQKITSEITGLKTEMIKLKEGLGLSDPDGNDQAYDLLNEISALKDNIKAALK